MRPPPFKLTPEIVALATEVAKLTGRFEGLGQAPPSPRLRSEGRIRTVHATAAIEGNTLDLDQVTALLEGRRVSGPARDILEVQNAIRAYGAASRFKPFRR